MMNKVSQQHSILGKLSYSEQYVICKFLIIDNKKIYCFMIILSFVKLLISNPN